MGTNLLTENGLLLQIALLSQFTIQGIGMTVQTLIGNFKGKGEYQKMIPLLLIAIVSSLVISLAFASSAILFPETIFGILTNHTDIIREIGNYTIWLLPLLVFTAIVFMLEAYVIGLKEGAILRNSSLIAFAIVFIPLIQLTIKMQSINLLWFSLTAYMVSLMFSLAIQIPRIQRSITTSE